MNNQPAKLCMVALVAFLVGVTCQRIPEPTFDYRNRMDFETHGDAQYQAGVEDGRSLGVQAVLHDLSMMDQSAAVSNVVEHLRMEVER